MTKLEITKNGRFNLREETRQHLAQELVHQHENRPEIPPEELHVSVPAAGNSTNEEDATCK